MRCYCCNKRLSDFEATRRSAVTKEFLDMCLKCSDGTGIRTLDRPDLEAITLSDDEFLVKKDEDDREIY